jgi:hypothetical protein
VRSPGAVENPALNIAPRHRIKRCLALHEDRAHADLVQTGFAQRFIRALPPLLEGAFAGLLLRQAFPPRYMCTAVFATVTVSSVQDVGMVRFLGGKNRLSGSVSCYHSTDLRCGEPSMRL